MGLGVTGIVLWASYHDDEDLCPKFLEKTSEKHCGLYYSSSCLQLLWDRVITYKRGSESNDLKVHGYKVLPEWSYECTTPPSKRSVGDFPISFLNTQRTVNASLNASQPTGDCHYTNFALTDCSSSQAISSSLTHLSIDFKHLLKLDMNEQV